MVTAGGYSLHDACVAFDSRCCNARASADTTSKPGGGSQKGHDESPPSRRTLPLSQQGHPTMRKALSITSDKIAHSPTIGRIPKATPPPADQPRAAVCDTSGSCGLVGGHREFLPHGAVRKARTPEQMNAAAPALDYPATKVGTVGNMTLSYDPALGA